MRFFILLKAAILPPTCWIDSGTTRRKRAQNLRTPSFLRKKSVKIAAAVTLAAGLVLSGGAAQAVLTGISGTYVERNTVVTQNVPYTYNLASGDWQAVPGMSRMVTIASGTRRALDTHYTAESQCEGGSGYCSVRIVYIRSGVAGVVELNPVAGTDFAFDSVDTDRWESNAIGRISNSLPAGTYTVRVEARKVGAVTTLRLDEQYFKVGVLRL